MSNNDSFFSKPVTQVFSQTFNSDKRIIINQGGTRSGKTWAIMQIAVVKAITEPGIVFTVVGQDIPNMKKGPMEDLRRIFNADPHLRSYLKSVNNTDRLYFFTNGSKIEFNSYDSPQDAHSGSRDYSFFNEANGIPYGIYRQVAMRTRKKIYIDFNPSSEFWAHTEVYKPLKVNKIGDPILDEDGKEMRQIPDNVVLFKSNWRHNPHLEPEIIADIESYKTRDPEYYKVYGLGEMGVIEGLVYKRVEVIPEWPEGLLMDARIGFGLDFGYSNDPNAMIRRADKQNILYVDELVYGNKMGIDELAIKINKHAPHDVTYCDVAPLLIHELAQRGCILRAVIKKPNSIIDGIKIIQSYEKICVTARSLNIRREFANYKYGKDRNNENETMPIDAHNHACDALRYAELMKKYVAKPLVFELNPFAFT